jgi:hypothetical protein
MSGKGAPRCSVQSSHDLIKRPERAGLLDRPSLGLTLLFFLTYGHFNHIRSPKSMLAHSPLVVIKFLCHKSVGEKPLIPEQQNIKI